MPTFHPKFDVVALDATGQVVSSMRVGNAGSQVCFFGLWIAAYAGDRRPEANRVTTWVVPHRESRDEPGRVLHLGGPTPVRDRPETALALAHYDVVGDDGEVEGTGCFLDEGTVALERMVEPVTDPDLAALLAFYDVCGGVVGTDDDACTVSREDTLRVEQLWSEIVHLLVPSSWYETMVEARDVARIAAATPGAVLTGGNTR